VCQSKRLIAPLHRLIQIAQYPQDPSCIRETTHTGVEFSTVMLLRLIVGYPLLEMPASRGHLSTVEQRMTECIVGFHNTGWIMLALS
jgi:hypothetical protein